ncbi:MAG: acyl-CoA dehydrogenase family protein [Myxococcales bacterium]|nr:acyl-CoA dehydrogenase family protein [Myxococcales bacterium]
MARALPRSPLALGLESPATLGAGLAVAHATPAEAEALPLVLAESKRLVATLADAARIDREGCIPESLRQAVAEAGLFGLTVPEEHGGAGFSLKSACAVIADIATIERSTAIMIGLHSGLGTRPLVELGSDELRARLLPEIASGARIAAFAATEAEAGSDLTGIRTTGTVTDAGIQLDGEKVYVTNGGFAGCFTVLARTPGLGGARAHSLVLIPRETVGVSIGPEEDKLGIRGSSTLTVTFEGATVPSSMILGEPGRGIDQAHAALAWGRTLMAAGCVGTARAALEQTLSHVTSRQQFQRSIGDFSASRAQVARMAAQLYAAETLVRWVGHALAAAEPIDELSLAAKVVCSETSFEICDRAIQLHGALGFIEPTGVARLLRDCRITRIFEGANDVLLVRGGAAVLGRKPGADSASLAPSLSGPLEREAKAWDSLRARFVDATLSVRTEHGVGVVRHQLVLQAVARASLALTAALGCLLRAHARQDDLELSLARHATEDLMLEAERHLDDLGRAVRDESRVHALSEHLYAPFRRTAARSPESPE